MQFESVPFRSDVRKRTKLMCSGLGDVVRKGYKKLYGRTKENYKYNRGWCIETMRL